MATEAGSDVAEPVPIDPILTFPVTALAVIIPPVITVPDSTFPVTTLPVPTLAGPIPATIEVLVSSGFDVGFGVPGQPSVTVTTAFSDETLRSSAKYPSGI